MATVSPTLEGFRAAFRRPAFTVAEIAWRWCVGATATALFFFGLFEYLDTLPVTRGELLLLHSGQPYLIGQALAHIFRGSLNRLVASALIAALLLILLWIIAASLGRIATVRTLIEYFRERWPKEDDASEKDVRSKVSSNSFVTLLRLHFLRVVAAVAAILGVCGAIIVAGFASPDKNPQPGLAFLLFLPLAALVLLIWLALNWLLSLAAVFAVRDGEETLGAISTAVSLCRERTGAVAAVSAWSGLAHLVLFGMATTVVSVPLGMAGLLPGRLVLLGMILVTLAYLAIVDWIYMARLAGYVCIVEMPEEPVVTISQAPPLAPIQTSIDRNEPILSDVPGLAPQT